MTEINKYHHSKIYRIFAVINGEIQPKVYIGASIQNYLSRRFSQHKDNYINYKKGRLHKVSTSFDLFDLYGVKNTKIELIEIFKCETKEDLHKRELQVIKKQKAVLITILQFMIKHQMRIRTPQFCDCFRTCFCFYYSMFYSRMERFERLLKLILKRFLDNLKNKIKE